MQDNDDSSSSDEQIDMPLAAEPAGQFHAERPQTPFPHKPGHHIKLTWNNIEVTTMDKKRTLLTDLSGCLNGKLTAIMGPTGAGKTTLMNTLAHRANGVRLANGVMEIDGHGYNRHTLKGVSGYVMQDDILFENLTVRETLLYAASLRLPRDMPGEQKRQRVDETIAQMQLDSCQDLLVGNPRMQGISGSERKRLCIAIELLMRPRLLFLDEPTTGLDSTAAYSLVSILRDLAHSGACSIVSTIHQPQAKIIDLFDDLTVLYEGQLIYSGPANQVARHYANAGFPCPPGVNPADHLMEVITPMSAEERDEVRQHAVSLMDQQKSLGGEVEPPQLLPGRISKGYRRVNWLAQFWLLFKRALLLQLRDYQALLYQLVQVIIMAILIGTAFLELGVKQDSYNLRLASIFFITVNQGTITSMIAVNAFPSERAVVVRERAAGTYRVSAYFLGKVGADLLVQLGYPVLFSCIVYFLIGYQTDAGKFFLFTLLVTQLQICGFAMATMVASIGRTTGLSLAILPLALEVWRLFGGFFMPPNDVPGYFVWLDAIDFIKYGYIGLAINELDGLQFVCDPSISEACLYTTGQDIMIRFGYDQFSIGQCIGILFAFIIGFRAITYIVIRFFK